MERRPKARPHLRASSIDVPEKENVHCDFSSLPHIEDFIHYGQIVIGIVRPVGSVAIASQGRGSVAMLRRRNGEFLNKLLARLDLAIARAMADDVHIDEINT